jgi:hypothetical protein
MPDTDASSRGTAAFGGSLPARTAVGARLPGYPVEIDCIAALPPR